MRRARTRGGILPAPASASATPSRPPCRAAPRTPIRAPDRVGAEWVAIFAAVMALPASCRSLNELAAKIAEQSGALRKVPDDAVVLSTIHSAKGLQCDTLFRSLMCQCLLLQAHNV